MCVFTDFGMRNGMQNMMMGDMDYGMDSYMPLDYEVCVCVCVYRFWHASVYTPI